MHVHAAQHDRFPLIDNILVQVWQVTKSGRLRPVERFSVHNLITSAGKDLAASRLIGTASPAVGWFAVGTGSTAPNVGNTTLGTEVFRDVLTSSIASSTGVATFSYFLNTSSANGFTLAEVGLFNASSVGTMYARSLLSPTIVKNSTKAVTFTWVSTFA